MFDDSKLVETQIEMGDAVIDSVYAMDESETLSEAAEKLREFSNYLIELEDNGWQLTGAIDGEFGYIYKAGVEMPDVDTEEDENY